MIGNFRFKWDSKTLLGRFSITPESPNFFQVSIFRVVEHTVSTLQKETNDLPHVELTDESITVPEDIEKELVYAVSLNYFQPNCLLTYYRRGISNMFGVVGSEVDFPMNFYTEENGLVSSRPGHAIDFAHDIATFQLTFAEEVKHSLVATGGKRAFVCSQQCERSLFLALQNSALREAEHLNDPQAVKVSAPIPADRTVKLYNGFNDMYEVRPNSTRIEMTVSRIRVLFPFFGDLFGVFPIVPNTDVNGPYTLAKFMHLTAVTFRYDIGTTKLSMILFQSIPQSSFNTVILA